MNTEEIKALRMMAKYPTVTVPRDPEILKAAADFIEAALSAKQGEQALQDVSDPAPSVNAQEPCDMGQMCLNCQPRGLNGECPDKAPEAKQEAVASVINTGTELRIKWLAHPRDIDHGAKLYTHPAPSVNAQEDQKAFAYCYVRKGKRRDLLTFDENHKDAVKGTMFPLFTHKCPELMRDMVAYDKLLDKLEERHKRIRELEAQNAKTLTNEQIDELWRKSCSLEGFSTAQFVRHFARAAIAAVQSNASTHELNSANSLE